MPRLKSRFHRKPDTRLSPARSSFRWDSTKGGNEKTSPNNGTEGAEIAEEYQQVIDSAAEVEETLEDAKDRIDEAVDDIDGQD